MTGETHKRSIVVWDVPTAVEAGRAFRMRVGLKCAAGCTPDAWTVEIRDRAERVVATADVSHEPLRGTSGLFFAELELLAPEAEGLHAWQAVAPAVSAHDDAATEQEAGARTVETRSVDMDDEVTAEAAAREPEGSGAAARAHADARASFNVRTVPEPECRLTVVAIDRDSQAPVSGAKVVIHPYRAFTNARGVAEVRVPKGAYRLFVSGRDYAPFRYEGEVTDDLTVRAELNLDLGPSDAELWS